MLNGVLEGGVKVLEAARLMEVSERHTWRLLAAYRRDGAAAVAHGNGGRKPPTTTARAVQERVRELAKGVYAGLNHTHLTEMLAEREGIGLSRSTMRRILLAGEGVSGVPVAAELPSTAADGSLVVVYQGKTLAAVPAPSTPVTLRARNGRRSNGASSPKPTPDPHSVDREHQPSVHDLQTTNTNPQRPTKPPPDHPWRRPLLTKSLNN